MKKQTKSKSTERGNKPTLVAFLLDRTGSMESCKDETIKGFNGYLDELEKKDKGAMRFTLTQFDSIGIDVIHNSVPLKSVVRLNDKTYQPRSGTPLYDAMGKTIQATQEAANKGMKVLFVVLTDGQENASSEWNESTIKTLIKEKEDKDNWTFAYIGVNPMGWGAVASIARGTVGASNALFIDRKDTGKGYKNLALRTSMYACSASGTVSSATNFWGGKSGHLKDEPEKVS